MTEAAITATDEMLEVPGITEEEIAAMEAEREAMYEAKLAPCREAAQKRNSSAEIIAEHDDMLAEMLYEVTMLAFGEEVL